MTTFSVISNNASSTLSAAIDDTDTTVLVVDGSEFPTTYPYYLTISPEDALAPTEAEIVTVTNRTGNTLTVTRGAQGTTAVAHDADELIELRPTKNLWTEAYDAINAIEAWDTDDVPEGSNLYFTDERARDAINLSFTDSATIDFSFSDPGDTITGAVLDSPLLQGQNSAYHLARGNHTGTQVASTISDFASAVGAIAQPLDSDLSAIAGLTLTKGDLIVGGGAAWVDLAVGGNGDVLTADSSTATGLKWETPAGGSHTQNTDIGTDSDTFYIGGTDSADILLSSTGNKLEIRTGDGGGLSAFQAEYGNTHHMNMTEDDSAIFFNDGVNLYKDASGILAVYDGFAQSDYAIMRGATPVGDDDFATKEYVDDEIAGVGEATTVSDTSTVNLTLTGTDITGDVVAGSIGTSHLSFDVATQVELDQLEEVFTLVLADKQPLDAELTALAGLTSAADRLPYFTGSGTASLATFTSHARNILDDANAAATIATLGLDADLATFAVPASTTISAFGATLVDDADASTARSTLGLTIGTHVQAFDADLSALAAVTVAQGDLLYGTGAATVAALAKNTNATRYLSNTGSSNNPAWAQVDLSNGVTGTLPMSGTALTVTDSTSIDFTYSGNDVTGVVPGLYRAATSPPSPLPWRYTIDEGTVNLAPDTNTSRFETTVGTWVEYEPTGGTTLTRETTSTYIGNGRGQVVVNTAGSGGIGAATGAITVSALTRYVGAVWLRGAVGGETVTLQLVGNNSGATSSNAFILSASRWLRCPLPKTTNASDTTITVRVITTTATTPTFSIGAFQLEAASAGWGTSYSDSTLGQGHTSMTRSAGIHLNGEIAENSSAPFQIASNGDIVSNGMMTFRGDRYIPVAALTEDAHFYFVGSLRTSTTTLGDEVGVVRIKTEGDGNALYVDADNVTTQAGQIISLGGATTGTALILAIPSNLSGFTGKFFSFDSKSGLNLGYISKDRMKLGSPAFMSTVGIEGYGGGRWAESVTATGNTATNVTVTVTASAATFAATDVGRLIQCNGQRRRIATFSSSTVVTVDTAPSPGFLGNALSFVDAQYKPFMYIAERSTFTQQTNVATADHYYADTASPMSAQLVGETGRWMNYRGTVNGTVPAPTADSDSLYFTQEAFRSTAQTQSHTSTSEDTVFTASVLSDWMGPTGELEVKFAGTISSVAGTATCTIRYKLGATTLFTEVLTPPTATDRPFTSYLRIANSTASAQKNSLDFKLRGTAVTALAIALVNYGTSAVATTSANNLVVTAQWSVSNAANKFSMENVLGKIT